jgi:hypothetical protein
MTGTLERTDTGTHAVVRVIEPDAPVSAPYSRAVGRLEKWVADERHAVDEFAAWIEGQAAQAHAEMRLLCDELGLPVAWAEYQPVSVKRAELRGGWTPPGRRSDQVLREAYERTAPVAAEFPGALPLLAGPAPDENMPGRLPRTMLEPASIDFDDDIDPPDIPMKRKGWTPQGTFPLATREPDDMLIVHRKITDEEADRIKRYWQARHGKPVEVKRERRSWSAEWAAFREDVKDMWRDLRQSLTWWRKEED